MALAAAVIDSVPVRYTATASVVVSPSLPDPLQTGGPEAVLRDDEVSTQAALLTSRDLAQSVIADISVGDAFGGLAHLKPVICGRVTLLSCDAVSPMPPAEQRLTSFLSRLRATPLPRTRVIELSYTDANPAVAAQVLNALVGAYQQQQILQRSADLARTSGWITERVEALRRVWLDAEAKTAKFTSQSGLTPSGSRLGSAPLVSQQVSSGATSLSAAQNELAAARARYSALKAASTTSDRRAFLAMRDEPGLVALNTQLAPLQAQLADMRQTFGANFPRIAATQAQIDSIERQIRVETTRILRAVEVELQVKQAAVNNLSASLTELRGDAAASSAKQGELSTLEDEARSARTVFETFLARAKQLDDRVGLLQSQVQFAAHAVAPAEPSSPPRSRLWLGALCLSLLAGTGAAWLRDIMSRGMSNISRVSDQLAAPFLCAIPAVSSRSGQRRLPHYVHLHPFSSVAESIRTLLTQFQLQGADGRPIRTVVIASATGQEGKTTTSLWLASAAAQGKRRVLLIDGDHRRGMISQRLGGKNRRGFSDMVFGGAGIPEVLQHDPELDFDFIGAGAPISRSFGKPDMERLRGLLRGLEQDYDLVIVDTPPLLAVTDALLYASLADGTVFLCRWSRTSRLAAANCLQRLRGAHATVLGVAVSMVDHGRLAQYSDELTRYDVRVMQRYYVN